MDRQKYIVEEGALPLGRFPKLTRDEVHVWKVNLSIPESMVGQREQMLSETEKLRAARLSYRRHRTLFIAAHRAKSAILST